MAEAAPDWLTALITPEWGKRYGRKVEIGKLPGGKAAVTERAEPLPTCSPTAWPSQVADPGRPDLSSPKASRKPLKPEVIRSGNSLHRQLLEAYGLVSSLLGRAIAGRKQAARQSPCKEDDRAACPTSLLPEQVSPPRNQYRMPGRSRRRSPAG